MVEWGTGENITEPFTIIIGGDTGTCDLYADDSHPLINNGKVRVGALVVYIFRKIRVLGNQLKTN